MERLKGKCLVRKSRTTDGKPCLILAGAFFPSEPLDSFSDRDEMWAVELLVADVIKFVGRGNGYPGGPEDFLAGVKQHPANWEWKP